MFPNQRFQLRVNYDTPTWGLIGDQLATNHLAIPALQRATIICDVADLARNGYVSQVIMIIVNAMMMMIIWARINCFKTMMTIALMAKCPFHPQETMSMVLAYRALEEDFGPLLAFKECVDSKGSYDAEKDLAF